MTTTNFINHTANQEGTLTDADWFNDLDNFYYTIFGGTTYANQSINIDATTGDFSVINSTGTSVLKLVLSEYNLQIGVGLSTEITGINVGDERTDNGYSRIDLIGDPVNTDYGSRFQRGNTGENAYTAIFHKGTGPLVINAEDAAPIQLKTNSTTALTVESSQDVSIGTTCAFFDVSTNSLQVGKNLATETATIELGTGRTGNGNCFIDLIGDATYTDYGLRISRLNTGANATTNIDHRGTGQLNIKARDAGTVSILTNNTTALTVDSSQNVGIGIATPDKELHVWRGTAGLINSHVNALVTVENSSDALIQFLSPSTSTSGIFFGDEALSSSGRIAYGHVSDILSFYTNNTLAASIDSSQNVGIGISIPDTNLHVWNGSAGTVSASATAVLAIENSTHARLQILTPNTATGSIYFGDPDDNDIGRIDYNHATDSINLYAAATLAAQIDDDATAGNTRLLIYDVDNATLERISVGAADSGGVGYKLLRIPN